MSIEANVRFITKIVKKYVVILEKKEDLHELLLVKSNLRKSWWDGNILGNARLFTQIKRIVLLVSTLDFLVSVSLFALRFSEVFRG